MARIPDLTRVPLSDGDAGPAPIEMFYGRGAGVTYHHEVAPAPGVAAGTPYEWVMHTAPLSTRVVIPGTPGVADLITVSDLHTAEKAITVAIRAEAGGKTISWTSAAAVKQRSMS